MVVTVLMLLRARRYWWVVVALLVLSLTRNVVIAMVPVIIAHAVVRWRQGDEGPSPVRFRWGMAALAAWAGPADLALADDRLPRHPDPGRLQPDDARLEHPDQGEALHVVEPAPRLLGRHRAGARRPRCRRLHLVHALPTLVAVGARDLGLGRRLPGLHHHGHEHHPEPRPLRPARLPDDAHHRLVPQAEVVESLAVLAARQPSSSWADLQCGGGSSTTWSSRTSRTDLYP